MMDWSWNTVNIIGGLAMLLQLIFWVWVCNKLRVRRLVIISNNNGNNPKDNPENEETQPEHPHIPNKTIVQGITYAIAKNQTTGNSDNISTPIVHIKHIIKRGKRRVN